MSAHPEITINLYRGNLQLVNNFKYSDVASTPIILLSNQYLAGDVLTVKVQYDWHGNSGANDYTVSMYSRQNLEIKDSSGKTNQIYMDNVNTPSGLNIEPMPMPTSFWDLFVVAKPLFTQYDIFDLFFKNLWTLDIVNWFNQYD
jgi:hypothetical protein